MDGTPPQTDVDHLIKDNLGRYWLKTFEMANEKERWNRRESSPGPLA